MICRIEVEYEELKLTEYPIAEQVKGGWQSGVRFFPDEKVTAILGQYVHVQHAHNRPENI